VFPVVSVGASENLLMAAALAKGETELVNVAREPEVVDLGHCLMAMGAKIDGLGTDTVRIQGVDRLHAAQHQIVADRIEAGTYAIAAAITGGDILLRHAHIDHLPVFVDKLREAGVTITAEADGMRVARTSAPLIGVDVMTEPFPGFATDLQAQTMALMTVANGAAMMTETIFENRFMHVNELLRLGAHIQIDGKVAMVEGVAKLSGATVMATDLRASASLVIAGLVASGETVVDRIYHLDRGYDRMEDKLRALGADIERSR
jgi:UDP-N-acetylglucosamine 1-carboxyvinyltransferase